MFLGTRIRSIIGQYNMCYKNCFLNILKNLGCIEKNDDIYEERVDWAQNLWSYKEGIAILGQIEDDTQQSIDKPTTRWKINILQLH